MADQLGSLDIIRDLGHMSHIARQLVGKEKKYEVLLKHLLSLRLLQEGSEFPAIKDISSALDMPYYKIKKQLGLIYQDLTGWEEEEKIEKRFDKVRYDFRIKARKKYQYWTLHSLAHVPRVGEQMDLPFFKAKLCYSTFHVKNIIHELYRDMQIVNIWLEAGRYNKFWHIRRDEAELKNQVHWRDFLDKDDNELQQDLGLIK